jgi:hypothetical protein
MEYCFHFGGLDGATVAVLVAASPSRRWMMMMVVLLLLFLDRGGVCVENIKRTRTTVQAQIHTHTKYNVQRVYVCVCVFVYVMYPKTYSDTHAHTLIHPHTRCRFVSFRDSVC